MGNLEDSWALMHSLACIVFCMLFFIGDGRGYVTGLVFGLVGYGFAMFAVLMFVQRCRVMRLPNMITLLRLGAGGVFLCWMAEDPEFTMRKFFFLSAAALTDFIDGMIARRKGSTAFGAKLDMEVDAFFILSLSVNGFVFAGMGAWILIIGLMRYGYEFILLLLPAVGTFSGFVRYEEKTICAFTVIALISIAAPFFPYTGKLLLSLGALILLGLSFLLNMCTRIFIGGIKH